jgi:hypothetical protein
MIQWQRVSTHIAGATGEDILKIWGKNTDYYSLTFDNSAMGGCYMVMEL